VAVSGDNDFELADMRIVIAKNLPDGVTLIVYIEDQDQATALKSALGGMLQDRLKFVVVPTTYDSDPIWARDALPFPVHLKDGSFGLVDSIYPQDFEPDSAIGHSLSLPLVKTGQEFRGGNLLFDKAGNCFSENVNETAGLQDPEKYLKNYFGCQTVTLLKQRGGIGDIDERIKFLDGNVALTDDDDYAGILQGKGYQVQRIPSTGLDGETYMNTLYVNGTVFVPQMGIDRDKDAVAAYAALGMKAVGIYTKQLADQGLGNIHCTTMNYPQGTFTASLRGADFVEFAARH
jgi:hypothetical protein